MTDGVGVYAKARGLLDLLCRRYVGGRSTLADSSGYESGEGRAQRRKDRQYQAGDIIRT